MEISKKLLYRNLHFLAIEQLAEEYESKGFRVEKESKLGQFRADIIATKGEEKIVIEVKAGRMNSARKNQLAKLADYVNSLGNYKFKVVIASPPQEKTNEVFEIEDLIFQYLIQDLPSELDELSTHTNIEEIRDISIHKLIVQDLKRINARGIGVVEVRVQFGSDGDQKRGDGHFHYEQFPFEFNIYLTYNENGNLEIIEESVIEINTESYYE